MSLVTPRKGYKSVPWLFGKEIEIPQEWEAHFCSNVFELKHGHQFGESDFVNKKGIKILRIEQITMNGTINLEKCDSIDFNRLKDFKHILIQEGDILLSLTGQLIKPAIVPELSKPVLQNYRVGKFITKNKNKLYKKYIYYLLNSTFIMKQLMMLRNTQAQPNIGKADFDKIKTILPLLSEQQKITSILSNVDNLIESTEKVITNSKKVKTGLMQKLLTRGIGHTKFKKVKWLFGKIIEIPEEWEIKEIIDVGQNFGDAPFGSMLKTVDFTEKGIPIARGINIKNNQFKWIHPLYTSKEKFDSLERSHCHEGDIGFQKIGNSIGDIAIMPKIEGHDVYLLSTNMMKMSVNPNIILTDYVFYYFSQNRVRDFIKLNSNGSAKPIFNFTTMKKFKIILPSLPEQQKIASILSNVDIQITSQTQYKEKLERLKKSLMQKLLTGEIRV